MGRDFWAIDTEKLRESVERGCGWCSVLWQCMHDVYGAATMNEERTFKGMWMAVILHWALPPPSSLRQKPTLWECALHIFVPQGREVTVPVSFEPLSGTRDSASSTCILTTTDGGLLPNHLDESMVSTASEPCHILAMDWWKQYEESHEECKIEAEAWLPTRLIDVNKMKLVSSSELSTSPPPPYIALSHRWGVLSGEVFRLVSSNESELRDGLPFDKLSQVFRDAIQFTVRSGIAYLWIDRQVVSVRNVCEIYTDFVPTPLQFVYKARLRRQLEGRSCPHLQGVFTLHAQPRC
jgi:hypothetical protein